VSATDSARGSRGDRAARWILFFALLIALDRFWKLSRWSLWFDETATWTDAQAGPGGSELGHPLGYRAIALVVEALGGVPDEFALRFLPALAGWLAVPLTYWAFRPLAGSRRAAAAALLVAASSWHVYWSQNARFYTMAQDVSLIGAGLLLRGLWQRRTVLSALGFACAGAAALFHPSAGLVLPALAVAPLLLRLARGMRPLPDVRVAIGILALFAVALLVRYDWARRTIATYVYNKPQSSPAHLLLTTGFYVTPLLCVGALFGAVLAFLRRDARHVFGVLVACLVMAAALCMSLFARISAQYVFVVLPWIALLACVPLESADECEVPEARSPARYLRVAWLAVLVLPALATSVLYFTVRAGERPRWREAYEYVWNQREEGDLVLGMEASVGEYYLNPSATDLRHPTHVGWLDSWRAREPFVWAEQARRMWLILNPEQLYDWDPADAERMRRFLAEECRLVQCYPLYVESRDLSVWVYVRG
jgi:4-amino-4-deoxy-L-arabinose transferase-like glycosyltransferase